MVHLRVSKLNVEQLDEIRQHAEAGEGLPPAEHLISVEASLAASARSKMEAALETLKDSFAGMKQHGVPLKMKKEKKVAPDRGSKGS